MAWRIPNDKVIEALKASHGLVYNAACALNCSAEMIYTRIKAFPEVKRALDEARGLFVDLSEQKLYDAVNRGDPWAVALVVRTLGKNRGYTERSEVTGADGGPLTITYVNDWRKTSDDSIPKTDPTTGATE